MKSLTLIATIAIAIGFAAGAAAHEFQYSALLSGAAESPANASTGTGTATVTLDLDLITMRVQVQFSGLSSPVTASLIHATTATAGIGTAIEATQLPSFPGFPTGVTSGTYDQTIDLTTGASYNPAFITASGGMVSDALNALNFGLADGKAYLNINTGTFQNGEMRGFLVPVPEPATVVLFALGGMALLAVRRTAKTD